MTVHNYGTLSERWDAFYRYLDQNPEVWSAFERFTFEAIKSGHKKLSAWLVANRVRWEGQFAKNPDERFKVANGWIAFLARHFMEKHPEYEGLFTTRELSDF